MIATQYRITLPSSFDMRVIRDRVSANGAALDDYPGLGLKVYLVREKGVAGSPVSEYAPFYLWRDSAAIASFLWGGDGFGGIVRDFGRPMVQTWVGGAFSGTSSNAKTARVARVRTRAVPDHLDPQHHVLRLGEALERDVESQRVLAAAYGVDPTTWQTVEILLYADRSDLPSVPAGDLFDVLHVSAPGADSLPRAVRSQRTS